MELKFEDYDYTHSGAVIYCLEIEGAVKFKTITVKGYGADRSDAVQSAIKEATRIIDVYNKAIHFMEPKV